MIDIMDHKKLSIIILAAGKGKRMKSDIPKTLHPLCFKPMIYYILKQAYSLSPKDVYVVLGHRASQVEEYIKDAFAKTKIVLQKKQLGTAHALMMLKDRVGDIGEDILILTGDMPLIRQETLQHLLDVKERNNLDTSMLTADMPDPTGYGRIVKDKDGRVERIVEEAEADGEQKKIREINTSIYCFTKKTLFEKLDEIDPQNSQNEYYLTDVIEKLVKDNKDIEAFKTKDRDEVRGINDRVQLAQAERILNLRLCRKLMEEGVGIRDPFNTFIEDTVSIGRDTLIEPYCFLRGKTDIAGECRIGPFCQIIDTEIGKNTYINSSMLVGSSIGCDNTIGPSSYIRPGTRTGDNVKIGAFCEVKKSSIDKNSKLPHLSYVGDTEIGKRVNIGASSVTLNYNGFTKSKTIIEDDVFIGSDTMLVAPVRIGKGSIVAAGSVISKDIPPNSLAIERGNQKNIKDGAIRYRERKKKQK